MSNPTPLLPDDISSSSTPSSTEPTQPATRTPDSVPRTTPIDTRMAALALTTLRQPLRRTYSVANMSEENSLRAPPGRRGRYSRLNFWLRNSDFHPLIDAVNNSLNNPRRRAEADVDPPPPYTPRAPAHTPTSPTPPTTQPVPSSVQTRKLLKKTCFRHVSHSRTFFLVRRATIQVSIPLGGNSRPLTGRSTTRTILSISSSYDEGLHTILGRMGTNRESASLRYRILPDRTNTYLTLSNEYDWNVMVANLLGRINRARSNPPILEISDFVCLTYKLHDFFLFN